MNELLEKLEKTIYRAASFEIMNQQLNREIEELREENKTLRQELENRNKYRSE
jgi:FtsZ-binding cell division protein ZapB